jgi:hypothetical protein
MHYVAFIADDIARSSPRRYCRIRRSAQLWRPGAAAILVMMKLGLRGTAPTWRSPFIWYESTNGIHATSPGSPSA